MGGIETALDDLGVGLAFIGNGSPAHARDFQASQGIHAPLYVDPSRASYQLFAFKEGLASTLNLKAVGHALRALKEGHRQGATAGHPFQQGGLALVLPGGSSPYLHRSGEAGDHPAAGEVLAAVKAALA